MMGEAAIPVAPDPNVQSGGRDTAAGYPDAADRPSGQRMLDIDLIRFQLRADAADRDVTAAVDDEPRVPAQSVSDGVSAQALAGAAGIEYHAQRAGDNGCVVVDRHLPPARMWVRPCRPALGGGVERLLQRCRRRAVERTGIAGPHQSGNECRFHESVAALSRPDPGTHSRAQQPRCRDFGPCVAVQGRQLTFRDEPRQAPGELVHEGARTIGGVQGRRCVSQEPRSDQQSHVAAHRVKRVVEFGSHGTGIS